ncbi:MAG TPA: ABC transporter permease [Vicinamibacterales bacterium]|nr:ABC transporter permease [Vicinamibacterales bacterium]
MLRFFRRGRLDAERAREMQAHIDHAVDDLIAAGYPRDRALAQARRRFGNPTAIREEIYRMNSVPVLEPIVRDVRYALRMLRKTPGFTAIALLTLALGIGANAAVFSAVDALLFEPLPYPHPDRLALMGRHYRSAKSGDDHEIGSNGRMWFAVRDHTSKVDVAVMGGTAGVNLVAAENVAYVSQQRVSAGYFRVLGIPPMIGREFTADEDRPGGQPVVILSHDLWQRLFGGDRAVVGKPVTLRGETYTVVGVTPSRFPVTEGGGRFDAGTGIDLWTPLRPSTSGEGGGTNYEVIARLREGVSWVEAQNDVRSASPDAFVNVDPGDLAELELVPMQAGMVAGVREPLLMLWGAVGIVLLIACVNIAGLLLARGATRTREIATRMALGSGRAAVVRQLLVESAVLALLGGVLGLAVASGTLSVLGSLGAKVFGLWQPLTLSARVLFATLAIALSTSVVFGLVPAVQTSRLDVQAALAETGTRAVAGASNRWPRRLLVIGEVALGVVLLVSAGLLIRTFVHLRTLDPGFDESNLVTASVSLQDARYREPQAVAQLFEETTARLRAVPGVQNAAVALGMPYSRLLNDGMRRLDGPQVDKPGEGRITNEMYVTAAFFETLRVPLRAGRTIQARDTAASPPVAVVNEAFVALYYKDDPQVIGRHLGPGTPREIVGIVGNTQQGASGWGHFGPISPLPCIYIPVSQTRSDFLTLVHTWFQPSWVVRSSLPETAVVPELRKAIASVDPQLPIAGIRTIDDLRGAKLESQRFMMWLVAGLGLIALVLAAVGVHGLIASSVNERTRELGIRLALGATGRQTISAVVIPGLVLAAVGVAIGTAAAFATARLLQSFVWGVTPSDPITFGAVIAVLMAIATAASVIPALRVLRLDPALTLRAE